MIALLDRSFTPARLLQLPKTWNASLSDTISIVANKALTFSNNVSFQQLDANHYEIDVLQFDSTTSFSINDNEITVYIDSKETANLDNWLSTQQLGHLIPILHQLGYDKLKEATIKAKAITNMQGTEYALNLLLDLLEVDDNVELTRIWKKYERKLGIQTINAETGSHSIQTAVESEKQQNKNDASNVIEQRLDVQSEPLKAYDDLHKAGLAKRGYELTNELRLQYWEDDLDSWLHTVLPNAGRLTIALSELLTILKQVIPATLRIVDIDLVRIGIGLCQIIPMSAQSIVQFSNYSTAINLGLPAVLQFSLQAWVFAMPTRRFIRVAEKHEKSNVIYAVPMHIDCPEKIYELQIFDEDGTLLCYLPEAEGLELVIIQPNPESTKFTYSYLADDGYQVQTTHQVQINKANGQLQIYEFDDKPNNANVTETVLHELFEASIIRFMQDYREVCFQCNGRTDFVMPSAYQVFYVPLNIPEVIVNYGWYSRSYQLHQVPKFSLDRKTVMQLDFIQVDGENVLTETQIDYWTLQSMDFVGKFAITMQYIDENGDMQFCQQEASKITTKTINPWLSANFLRYLSGEVGFPGSTDEVSVVDGSEELEHLGIALDNDNIATEVKYIINNDGIVRSIARTAIPPLTDLARWQAIQNMHSDFVVNYIDDTDYTADEPIIDGRVTLLAFDADTLRLRFNGIETFNKRRPASAVLKNVDDNVLRNQHPYFIFEEGMIFDLYLDGKLLQSSVDYIVFALVKSLKYQLHCRHQYFDKIVVLQA